MEQTEEELAMLLKQYEELNEQLSQQVPYPIGEKCGITFAFNEKMVLLPSLVLGYPDHETLQVLILTPVTIDTVPCEDYFGHQQCEDTCPFYRSHGYDVPLEYAVPYDVFDTTDMLQRGHKVWYKEESMEIWKEAKLVDAMDDDRWHIEVKDTKTKKKTYKIISIDAMIPYRSLDEQESSEEEEAVVKEAVVEEPVKYNPGWGAWQTHTTGFAAKMMKKMGYVEGKGLGLYGQGRTEPIEVTTYADKPVLGVKKEKKKKEEKKAEEVDMFELMNTLLAPPSRPTADKNPKTSVQTVPQLQAAVDRLQLEYTHASEAYRRNRHSGVAHQFKAKLKKAHDDLKDAKTALADRQRHLKQSKDRQNMYTF